VVQFDKFVSEPERIISELFTYLGLEYRSALLASTQRYAASSGARSLERAKAVNFSWADQHAGLIGDRIESVIVPALERLEARLGMELLPPTSGGRRRERDESIEREPGCAEKDIGVRPFSDEIIDMWKTSSSQDYKYYDKVEEQTSAFWTQGSPFRDQFDLLDRDTVVELACGKGRHTERAVSLCGSIWATDTSIDALAELSERFKEVSTVRPLLVTGDSSLLEVRNESVTAVFCYDAMVHFEMLTVAAYLAEISRILRQGGKALLHHSNFTGNPTGKFTENPGWRNFMSADIVCHLASRNRMRVVSQTVIDWDIPELDMLTVLVKD